MQTFNEKRQALMRQTIQFAEQYERRHAGNFKRNWQSIVLSLVLSVAIMVLGILDYGKAAAICGAVNLLIIGLQQSFAFGDLAQFQRLLAGEARRLIADLEIKVQNEEEFQVVYAAFTRLREHADVALPRGEGINAAIKLHDQVSGKKA